MDIQESKELSFDTQDFPKEVWVFDADNLDQGTEISHLMMSHAEEYTKDELLVICRKAAMVIDQLRTDLSKAQAVPEWISVENTIPNKNGDYIVCIDGEPCSAFFKWVNDHWKEFKVGAGITEGIHGWWHTHLNVTHWMLLPKPPKAQEQSND